MSEEQDAYNQECKQNAYVEFLKILELKELISEYMNLVNKEYPVDMEEAAIKLILDLDPTGSQNDSFCDSFCDNKGG